MTELENKKHVREALAFAHYVLNNRVQFLFEEFKDAAKSITTLKEICEHLQKEITEMENEATKATEEPKDV